MMFGHDGFGFGGGVIWIILIVVLFFVIKAATGSSGGSGQSNTETPLEILKKRYARGEIDEAEFKRRRKELES
jgi:putative membrane protein